MGRVEELIAANKIEEALEVIINSGEYEHNVKKAYLLKSKLMDLNDREIKGVISFDHFNTEMNKIRDSVLNIVSSNNYEITSNNINDYLVPDKYKMSEFDLIADLHVARFMSSFSVGETFLSSVLKFFGKEIDINQGHFTNSFDWDENTVYTPCDCTLAYNKWSIDHASHLSRIEGSNESYSTVYYRKFGLNSVFGNGEELYISDWQGRLNLIKNSNIYYNLENLEVSRENDIVLISVKPSNEGLQVYLLTKDDSNRYEPDVIVIPETDTTKDYNYKTWKIKITEPVNRAPIIFIFSTPHFADDDIYSDLILFDLGSKKYNILQLDDRVQDISIDYQKSTVALIGRKITIFNYIDWVVKKQFKLPRILLKEQNRVISFSRCGRFLATISELDGSVDIRNSVSFEIIKKLSGFGVPFFDASWDISSYFFASRYKDAHNNGQILLVVWNIATGKIVLKEPCSNVSFSDYAFRWSNYRTKLALLSKRKHVRVFSLKTELS